MLSCTGLFVRANFRRQYGVGPHALPNVSQLLREVELQFIVMGRRPDVVQILLFELLRRRCQSGHRITPLPQPLLLRQLARLGHAVNLFFCVLILVCCCCFVVFVFVGVCVLFFGFVLVVVFLFL